MAVHAHPDDEVEGTGGLLALTAFRGGRTSLVTLTDGALGRPDGEGLDPDAALAAERSRELHASAQQLGVSEVRELGWHDSGMAGDTANNNRPGALWAEPVPNVADALVAEIRRFRPHVVVTYDENGGYSHPDHIATHRAAVRAYDLAARSDYKPELGKAWMVRKLYYTSFPQAQLDDVLTAAQRHGLADPRTQPQAGVFAVTTGEPTTAVDATQIFGRKLDAMGEHRTQYPPDWVISSLPQSTARSIFGVERFRLAASRGVTVELPETDVFSGLTRRTPAVRRPQSTAPQAEVA
jgi:LmbE family N-acetylglucosaminyl deacetylase